MRHIVKVLSAPKCPYNNFYITNVSSSVWVHYDRFCRAIHDHLNSDNDTVL